MSQYHPLFDKVYAALMGRTGTDGADKAIRSHLEDVATKIELARNQEVLYGQDFREILGLSPSKEPLNTSNYSGANVKVDITPGTETFTVHASTEPKAPSGRWCEHLAISGKDVHAFVPTTDEHWKFCPICGTPRPVEKSLAEKFDEYCGDTLSFGERHGDRMSAIKEMAEIAEQHFREKKNA